MCCSLAAMGCWCCCCIPFLIDDFKDSEHYCSICGKHLGCGGMMRGH